MLLLLRPTLAIVPVSLLGPGLWLLVQSTRVSDSYSLSDSYVGRILEPALIYGVLPTLVLWLGSLPVALATWLLWRRISAWVIPAFAVAVMPSLWLVLYAARFIMPIPAGCYFNCPPGPGEVLPTSFAIAGVLAMLSLPVWIHLGTLHLRGCLQLVVVGLLVAVAAGCSDGREYDQVPTEMSPQHGTPSADAGQAPSMVFPQHDAPLGTDRGGEYFAGRLVLSEGCLRAEAPANRRPSWLIIWPSSFTLEADSGSVQIVDGHGRIAAHVGDHIRLSRAAVTYQQARDRGLVKGLSEDCAEPYFLVGDEVTVFDPGSEATELRLSDPDVLFLRQKTVVASVQVLQQAAGVGELVLDGRCLRLKGSSTTIIWPAGFTPHVEGGVVQVRNGAGRIIARVGDEIAGGGGYFDLGGGDCSGPAWRANKIKVLPDAEVYFPRQDGTLAPDQEPERFVGKLVLNGKCLEVDAAVRVSDRSHIPYPPLIIWPGTFAVRVEDGVVGIVDAGGRVVARVGDEVQFSALDLSFQQAKEHGGLDEITPACSSPYWAVGEEFTATSDFPENGPNTSSEPLSPADRNKQVLLDGLADGRILYFKIEDYQINRIIPGAIDPPDRVIIENWLQPETGSQGELNVAAVRDQDGGLLQYTQATDDKYTTTFVSSGETMETNIQWGSPAEWTEEIWNVPRNLASHSGFELKGIGELHGRATLIYEASSDSRKTRWELVEDAPILWRNSTYRIDSEGRETLTEEETVVEYRLLPPGSSIPQLP